MISLNLKSHISITCLKNGFIKCPSHFLHCLCSIPLALWPFITIAQQRFRKGRKNLQLPRSHHGNHSLLGMSLLQVCVTFSVLGKRSGEWEESLQSPSAAWEGVLGRSFLGCLRIPGEFFPNQGFHRGGAPAQDSAEKYFPNANEVPVLALKLCSFIPGNDSQHSKKLMISIDLCFIIRKGIQGALWKCLQKVKPSNNRWQTPVLGLRNLGDIGKLILEFLIEGAQQDGFSDG